MIRLFHREVECCLAAEGSFANDKKNIVEKGTYYKYCSSTKYNFSVVLVLILKYEIIFRSITSFS